MKELLKDEEGNIIKLREYIFRISLSDAQEFMSVARSHEDLIR